MTTEAEVKRRMVKSMHEGGGYARRIEDQYAVGTYDMIIIPAGLPVFTAEVKIIRANAFGPSPRQAVELQRITDVAAQGGHVIPVMIGWQDGVFYFHRPKMVIMKSDCFSVSTSDEPFWKQITQYYHYIRGIE